MVKYKQHRSTEMSVRTGVPQGSILGPLLFLIYINDIENCSKILSFVLYADDTNAFYSNSCIKTLASTIQNEMNEVVQWLTPINYQSMHPKQNLSFLNKKISHSIKKS